MNPYRLQLRHSAYRELERLRRGVVSYELVRDAIQALADDPLPRPSKQLMGRTGQRSRRIGDYRIVYTVHDDARILTIVRIRHRKDVDR